LKKPWAVIDNGEMAVSLDTAGASWYSPRMVRQLWHHRWKILGAELILGLGLAIWFGSRWLSAVPGSLEDVFPRIQIGMTQEEVIAVLRSCDRDKIEGIYAVGETSSGKSWYGTRMEGPLFSDLPPSGDIAHAELSVMDADQEIEVHLGSGGIVVTKQLTPGVWELRRNKIRHKVSNARDDLMSKSWWLDQVRKSKRSLRIRSKAAGSSLGTGGSRTSLHLNG
jgi:hypothetical protein